MNKNFLVGALCLSLGGAVACGGPLEELPSESTSLEASLGDSQAPARPVLSADEAIAIAQADASSISIESISVLTPRLQYVRPKGSDSPRPVWVVPVTTFGPEGMPVDVLIYVDAIDGTVHRTVSRNKP